MDGRPGSWSLLGTAATYSYDDAGRMTGAAGVSSAHDRNGNQTGRGSDTFTFNALNRMTQAVISSATSTYTYDGNGVRTQKVTGGVTTDYLQDVNGRLPRVAAEKVGSAWTYYLYGKNLIARRASDQSVQYYHFDGTGNVRAITNAAGAVVQRYDYDAFGALRNTPSGGVANDRRFSGEQQDAETGYSFLRARYYDPAIGRFTGRDAVEGGNSYTYTANNPVNLVDPSGYSEDGGDWTPCPSGGCAAIGWNPFTMNSSCGGSATVDCGAGGTSMGSSAVRAQSSGSRGYGYDYSYHLGIPLRVGAAAVMKFFLGNFGRVMPLASNCNSLSYLGQECFLNTGIESFSGDVRLVDMGSRYFSFLALENHRENGSIIYFSTFEAAGEVMLHTWAFGPSRANAWIDETLIYFAWAQLASNLHNAWVWDNP